MELLATHRGGLTNLLCAMRLLYVWKQIHSSRSAPSPKPQLQPQPQDHLWLQLTGKCGYGATGRVITPTNLTATHHGRCLWTQVVPAIPTTAALKRNPKRAQVVPSSVTQRTHKRYIYHSCNSRVENCHNPHIAWALMGQLPISNLLLH